MSMREGQRVIYVGNPIPEAQTGESGRLLMIASSTAGHVQWDSGLVSLVALEDISPKTAQRDEAPDLLKDSLDLGSIHTFAVRDVYEDGGPEAVISVMAERGHLSAFGEIADEALTMISSRLRQDPSFREVVAHLDPEEEDAVFRLAAACLIRDAFGTDENEE